MSRITPTPSASTPFQADPSPGHAARRRLPLRVLMMVGLALLGVLASGSTALASGGQPVKPGANVSQATTCAPIPSSPATGWSVATVYYVTATAGLKVHNGHGTGYCVIATMGYTADVVAVPGVATYNDGTYTWIQVAYYLNACQTCTNYSWSKTGWMAENYLHAMSSGFECVESAGCASYTPATQLQSPPPSSDPNLSQSNCNSNSYPMPCAWYANGDNEAILPYSTQYTVRYGAYTGNPNWFAYLITFKAGGFESDYYWNYDWWAH